jgi:peptide/nickel transport system permease protein
MGRWWTRPVVRVVLALALPFLVPLLIAMLIWAMPGDPASIVCPPEACGAGYEALAARWNLDQGPIHFYSNWMGSAIHGDLGVSWSYMTGVEVNELVGESIWTTVKLIALAGFVLLLGAIRAASRSMSKWTKGLFKAMGMVPALVLALAGSALITIAFGSESHGTAASSIRLLFGAFALALADASLSGTVEGVENRVESERRQRYVQIGVLRGESELLNVMPNILPALAGQFRARLLNLLSSAVIIEVILEIDGIGDMLWTGTVEQDFGLVLGCSFAFVVIASVFLLTQAALEIATALKVRSSPKGVVQ